MTGSFLHLNLIWKSVEADFVTKILEGLMATECNDDLRQAGRCAVTYDDVTTSFNFESHKQYTPLVQGERENAFRKIMVPDEVSVSSV
jgi:hypothetical protein